MRPRALRLAGAVFAVVLAADVFFAVDLAAFFLAGAVFAVDFAAVALVALVALAALDRVVFAGAFFAAVLDVDFAAVLVAGAFFAVDLAAVAFAVVVFADDFFAAVDFAAVDLAAVLRFAGAALSFVDLTARVAFDAAFLTAPAVFDAALAGDVLAVVRVGISASSTAVIDATERAAVRPVNAPRRTHAPTPCPTRRPVRRTRTGGRPPPHSGTRIRGRRHDPPPTVASGPTQPEAAARSPRLTRS